MLLADSLKDIHEDKLADVIRRQLQAGREAEVRQALPELMINHPAIAGELQDIQRELNASATALDMIASEHGVAFSCANCGGTVSRQSAKSQTVICQYCGCDAELPDQHASEHWPGHLDPHANFSIGSFFNYQGEKWQAIGVQQYHGTIREWDSEDKKWESTRSSYTLWWMLNAQRELAWLSDYGKRRYWSEKYIPRMPGLPEEGNRKVEYGSWSLAFAVGEFSYRPQPGEKKNTWEYTKRPDNQEVATNSAGDKLVYAVEASLDKSGNPSEFEFIRSVSVSHRSILKGIGADGILSDISRWKRTGAVLAGAGVLSLVSGLILEQVRQSDDLINHKSLYQQDQVLVAGELRIEETPAVVKFSARLSGGLPKDSYIEYEIDLSNSDDEAVGWVNVEFWRETGYDDGYYDESDYAASQILRIDEPGTYTIETLISEATAPLPTEISLKVTDNAVSKTPFVFALVSGVAAGMLSFIRGSARASSGASLGGRLAPTAAGGRSRRKTARIKRKSGSASAQTNQES